MLRSITLSIVSLSLISLSGSSALAGGCGGGGGGGGHHGGGHHGGGHRWCPPTPIHVYKPAPVIVKHVTPVCVEPPVCPTPPVDPCCHPAHCFVYVLPGESLSTICEREYGRANVWQQVAKYNGLAAGAQLSPNRPVMLPSIYDSGKMVPSTAPAPPLPTPTAAPTAAPVASPVFQQASLTQAPVAPLVANVNPAPVSPASDSQLAIRPAAANNLPSFPAGSLIDLDGQQFGSAEGRVRLSIGVMTLPANVIDWNANQVRVQLPELELSGAADASIEVIDAAGNSIVRSSLRITPATARLALAN